jgi:hypothetical protein
MISHKLYDPITKATITLTQEEIKGLSVAERHLLVSLTPTPQEFVETIQGTEYVKCEYMREMAYNWYGLHSFQIIAEETLQDLEGNFWQKVHGRLSWIENGQPTSFDNIAAHRIQYSKGTKKFVDLGNDTKAAVTDCLKKTYNLGMNIGDDIYRWTGYLLTSEQREVLEAEIASIMEADGVDSRIASIAKGQIKKLNRASYQDIMNNLRRIAA